MRHVCTATFQQIRAYRVVTDEYRIPVKTIRIDRLWQGCSCSPCACTEFPVMGIIRKFSATEKKCMSGFMMCHRKYFMCANCRMERLDVFACDEYQLVSVPCVGHAVQNPHILCRNIVCTYLLRIIYALHPSF